MKKSYTRHFVALQRKHEEQKFRDELDKFTRNEVGFIIRRIIEWSKGGSLGHGEYKTLDDLYPGLARWRIDHFRIYTYHLGGSVWVMLHVQKKLRDELTREEKELIVVRARVYEKNKRDEDLVKYAKLLA